MIYHGESFGGQVPCVRLTAVISLCPRGMLLSWQNGVISTWGAIHRNKLNAYPFPLILDNGRSVFIGVCVYVCGRTSVTWKRFWLVFQVIFFTKARRGRRDEAHWMFKGRCPLYISRKVFHTLNQHRQKIIFTENNRREKLSGS